MTFTAIDTANLRAQGLPLHVANIALVSDSAVCSRALEALYAYDTTSAPRQVSGAYVFALDSSAYVVTPGNNLSLFTYYDRTWRRLAGLVALD